MDRPLVSSRRDVVRHGLSGGFALAVSPIAGSAFATSEQGLEVGEVTLPGPAGPVSAYRAHPAGGAKKLPVLLVVHEIFGVHEHIRELCRRFAKLGYFAVAPDLFARRGDASKIADVKQLLAEIVAKTSDAEVVADLDATLAWIGQQPRADVGRLGVTGFCWGGRITWLYAAHQPALKAAVAWYGKLVGERDALHPSFPLDVIGQLKAPVLGLYGAMDQSIALASIGQMKTALDASQNAPAKGCEFHVYPEAGHAFAADYRPSYRKAEAEDGFRRLHAWLKAHGVA